MKKTVAELKIEYEAYLMQLNIDSLRSLGRHVGVYNPTENKKKGELIRLIIAVLVGEAEPVDRTKRGAPVKAVLNPEVLHKLKEIADGGEVEISFDQPFSQKIKIDEKGFGEALKKYLNSMPKNTFVVKSSEEANLIAPTVFVGQVEKISDFYCLFPANARDFKDRIVISEATVQDNSLKEGDLISCTAKTIGSSLCVQEVLRLNEGDILSVREDFDEKEVVLSCENLPLKANKVLQYFLPLSKGCRFAFVGSPKSGKTTILKKITQDLTTENGVKTFALLIDQPIENAMEFRRLLDDRDLIYTTYEEEAEAHLFSAEFILKRAKRYAEQGKDVVLVVDGLQSLAKAYDELNYGDDKILSCGLSAKTIRFIKKFLASARAFRKGGSLTILCSLTNETGNKEDDLFVSEFSSVFNGKIALREKQTLNRIFPTIDLTASFSENRSNKLGINNEAYSFVYNEFLPKFGVEDLELIAQDSKDFEEFYQKAKLKFQKL